MEKSLERMLGLPEASRRTGLSLDYLRRLSRSGALPTTKPAGRYLVSEADLERLLDLGRTRARVTREEIAVEP